MQRLAILVATAMLLTGCATYEEIDQKNFAKVLETQAVQTEAETECHDEVNALYGRGANQAMTGGDLYVTEAEACVRAQRAAKATAAAQAEQDAEPRPTYGGPAVGSFIPPAPQVEYGPPASAYYVPNAPPVQPLPKPTVTQCMPNPFGGGFSCYSR